MSEAKWYVVHTYSGYENKVKANIDKTIENRHLEDQILEVRVPLEDVVEMKNGVQKVSQKKMFPGYVLIHMIMNDDTWYVVRNTRGVTGFVGPGSKPVPLTDAEMAPLGIQREEVVMDYEEGDTVQAGDVIGFMGRTGYSTKENVNNIDAVHLHFGLELIFDESQKECNSEIWIDVYQIVRLLSRHRSSVMKASDGTWQRVYAYRDLDADNWDITSGS